MLILYLGRPRSILWIWAIIVATTYLQRRRVRNLKFLQESMWRRIGCRSNLHPVEVTVVGFSTFPIGIVLSAVSIAIPLAANSSSEDPYVCFVDAASNATRSSCLSALHDVVVIRHPHQVEAEFRGLTCSIFPKKPSGVYGSPKCSEWESRSMTALCGVYQAISSSLQSVWTCGTFHALSYVLDCVSDHQVMANSIMQNGSKGIIHFYASFDFAIVLRPMSTEFLTCYWYWVLSMSDLTTVGKYEQYHGFSLWIDRWSSGEPEVGCRCGVWLWRLLLSCCSLDIQGRVCDCNYFGWQHLLCLWQFSREARCINTLTFEFVECRFPFAMWMLNLFRIILMLLKLLLQETSDFELPSLSRRRWVSSRGLVEGGMLVPYEEVDPWVRVWFERPSRSLMGF